MEKYLKAWRTSMLSESRNPLLLNEGLFDIGLPAEVAESINRNFEGVPEKGKTMIGNIFKNSYFYLFNQNYSAPLLNDVGNLIKQIQDTVLDDVLHSAKPLSAEDLNKAILFLKNNKNLVVGANSQESEPRTWAARVTDVQKIMKNTKKAFTTGLFAKILGETPDKGYLEMFESLASHIYEDYALAIGDMTLDLQTWLKSQQDEYKKIPELTKDSVNPAGTLIRYADKWIKDIETEEQKVHTFEDTSYWYDLKTDSCPIEADRMGHCGGDGRATTLYSLRYKNKKQQKSSSYVTVAYNPDTDSIYQIKGKFNNAPDKKFYNHIAWLIKALGNPHVFETGEHSDDTEGFEKMSIWLKKNTDAVIEEPTNAWEEMQELITATVNAYNDEYFYSKIFAEMAEEDVADEPSYYFKGYVGVPIELEELSEEGRQKLIDQKYSRDDIKVITKMMDDPRATGKLKGRGAHPVKIDGDYAIFFFDAADLVTSGISEGEWSFSSYDGDLRMFARDVLDMDREASVSGNRLQQDLVRALIATRFIDGGPFLNLYIGARSGELQENSDWVVETDVDGDDNPKLVWFQTPELSFDLIRFERGYGWDIDGELEYYKKPQVVEKILNSNAFKKTFMDLLSRQGMTTETLMPDIQLWSVLFENYRSPSFAVQAAWQVDKDDSESKAVVASSWLSSEVGKSDFEDFLHDAYVLVLEEAIGDEALGSQKSLDFPGGKRLPINESVSYKDIMKKWKGFKGF